MRSSQSKDSSPSKQETKITIVNQHSDSSELKEQFNLQSTDPLIQQLNQMKLTTNLIKEINFNSTVNRFQYLEQQMKKQYQQFDKKVKQIQQRQKDGILKNIKKLNKQIGKIGTQILNPKQSEFPNFLLNNPQQLATLHQRIQSCIQTKQNSQKYCKLSEGMLNAIMKIEKELDETVQKKLETQQKSKK